MGAECAVGLPVSRPYDRLGRDGSHTTSTNPGGSRPSDAGAPRRVSSQTIHEELRSRSSRREATVSEPSPVEPEGETGAARACDNNSVDVRGEIWLPWRRLGTAVSCRRQQGRHTRKAHGMSSTTYAPKMAPQAVDARPCTALASGSKWRAAAVPASVNPNFMAETTIKHSARHLGTQPT